MFCRISLLAEETIAQIAAGEIADSPVSVLKELIENSLDATSGSITVSVLKGGLDLIEVIDDGHGIPSDQLFLALERHATSKLRNSEDLLKISTFGFRGEALAAISAISELTISSATADGVGAKIAPHTTPIPHPRTRGTTITLKRLFHNVPARLAAQKSIPSLACQIHRLVERFALANPEITFRLYLHKQEILFLTQPDIPFSEQLSNRCQQILNLPEQLIPLEMHKAGISITGYIAKPPLVRPSRSQQYIFINRRLVEHLSLNYTIQDAYGPLIAAHRYPPCVLHISLPGVDPNVHPQKLHVRIKDEHTLRSVLRDAIRQILRYKESPIPHFPMIDSVQTSFNELFSLDEFKKEEIPSLQLPTTDRGLLLFNKYFLLPQERGWLLVDLQKAQQRICYEQMLNSQGHPLLTPCLVNLSTAELLNCQEHGDKLKTLGIEWRIFGEGTVLIEALPAGIDSDKAAELLRTCLAAIDLPAKVLARKASRLSRVVYSQEEGKAILAELFKCLDPWQALDGEAIAIVLKGEHLAQVLRMQ